MTTHTAGDGLQTALRLHDGEDWTVSGATLRRIGWLDQRGRAWKQIPPGAVAEEMRCGSFTPLLIDARDG